MNSQLHEDKQDINAALKSLNSINKYLEYTNQNIQSPNLKRQIVNIKRLVANLADRIKDDELKYRQLSLKNENRRRMMLEDERYRTNYNHNTDGRIKGAYYSGQGDMRNKK